jgi:hypothetical protein
MTEGCFQALSPIHDQRATRLDNPAVSQQLSPLRSITSIAKRKHQAQGTPSIRGNQMNLGGATAP